MKKLISALIVPAIALGILSGCDNTNEFTTVRDGEVDPNITKMVEEYLSETYGEISFIDAEYNRYEDGAKGGTHTYDFKFTDADGNTIYASYYCSALDDMTKANLPEMDIEVEMAEETATETTPPLPKFELPEGIDVIADTKKELERYRELYPDKDGIVDTESPTIKELESETEGFRRYVIDFYDLYPATLTIELPEQLSVRLYNEGERIYANLASVRPFYSSAVCICDENNNDIGGISANTITLEPQDYGLIVPGNDSGVLIYQGLFTGMGNTWDIGYTPIYLTEAECTATTYVCYPDYYLKDRYPRDYERLGNTDHGDSYFFNRGILSYNLDKLKYAAVEIDFDCVSDEDLQTIAKSISIS